MRFDPDKPFNDLPLLPPAADLESRAVLKNRWPSALFKPGGIRASGAGTCR